MQMPTCPAGVVRISSRPPRSTQKVEAGLARPTLGGALAGGACAAQPSKARPSRLTRENVMVAQEAKQRHKGQAEDRAMLALDAVEQMRSQRFQPVSAD